MQNVIQAKQIIIMRVNNLKRYQATLKDAQEMTQYQTEWKQKTKSLENHYKMEMITITNKQQTMFYTKRYGVWTTSL